MADGSKIEWTEATWNPITGCSLASPGCTNCYAMKLAGTRLQNHESRKGLTIDTKAGPVWTGEVRLNEQWLDQPLRWKRPRMIFVCAHGDLFHENVPDEWIDRVFAVMALATQHTFQVLTKRADRMRAYVNKRGRSYIGDLSRGIDAVGALARKRADAPGRDTPKWPLPNVWLGVSVEDQVRADERIDDLLATRAAKRWLSCEPLLGPLDLSRWAAATANCFTCNYHTNDPRALRGCKGYCQDPTGKSCDALPCPKCGHFHYWTGGAARLDWVVVGGENGPRPMHPDWARAIRDQCNQARVPFFFKQWGSWAPLGKALPAQPGSPGMTAWPDGTVRFGHDVDPSVGAGISMFLGTKSITGRMLDGRTWDEVPA